MEANKSGDKGFRNEKRRFRLTVGGGGGVGGLFVVGGALAVAGLVTAFTVIRSRSRRKDDLEDHTVEASTNEKTTDANCEGLRSVIQTLPEIVHQNSCCTSQETPEVGEMNQVDSCESLSNRNFLLEDKPVLITESRGENFGIDYQQTVVSDDLNGENIGACRDDESENMIKNESEEILQLVETVDENLVIEEKLAVDAVQEQYVKGRCTEEEEEEEEEEEDGHKDSKEKYVKEKWVVNDNDVDDSDQEHKAEKEEESSEGITSASSMESNVEAVWAAEMIEALSLEIKEMNINSLNSEKSTVKEDTTFKVEKKQDFADSNNGGSEDETTKNLTNISEEKAWEDLVMGNDRIRPVETRSSKWRVVRWSSVLVLLLLLLLLHAQLIASPDVLSYNDSVIP